MFATVSSTGNCRRDTNVGAQAAKTFTWSNQKKPAAKWTDGRERLIKSRRTRPRLIIQPINGDNTRRVVALSHRDRLSPYRFVVGEFPFKWLSERADVDFFSLFAIRRRRRRRRFDYVTCACARVCVCVRATMCDCVCACSH